LPVIESVVAFVAAVLVLYMGLRSLTFAISIKLGDAWGWTRDDGVAVLPGLSDRVVRAGISWLRRRREAAADTPHSGAVRMLPVEPPW
jgi:hypothetical protein